MNNKIKNTRILKKWSVIAWVNYSKTNDKGYWVLFGNYYEDQEYELWNDWEEGIGDNWKWSWRCKKQYKFNG